MRRLRTGNFFFFFEGGEKGEDRRWVAEVGEKLEGRTKRRKKIASYQISIEFWREKRLLLRRRRYLDFITWDAFPFIKSNND